MPGAVLRAEAAGVVAGGRVDDILNMRVGADASVAEVRRRVRRLTRKLDCEGREGAAAPLSYQTPPNTPVGLTACVPEEPQVIVPLATPSQYCVTELFHEAPPT
jgi:hypothetical protein